MEEKEVKMVFTANVYGEGVRFDLEMEGTDVNDMDVDSRAIVQIIKYRLAELSRKIDGIMSDVTGLRLVTELVRVAGEIGVDLSKVKEELDGRPDPS